MPGKRRFRWDVTIVAAAFIGLIAVLVALRLGVSPDRLWPVAGFLAVSAGSASYMIIAGRLLKRRAFRQRAASVPRGVRLRKPLWMRLNDVLTLAAPGAALGALIAGVGFPQVGVGILLVVVGAFGFTMWATDVFTQGLTFDDVGLRLHLRFGECLIPWSLISNLETIGPDHFTMVLATIIDPERVIESVSPDTPKNRERARSAIGFVRASQAQIMLSAWTAGLDGQAIERAIRSGIDGEAEKPN